MKFIKSLLMVFILLSIDSYAAEKVDDVRRTIGGACNFFVTDFCISLVAGDELKLSFPLDYTLYDLKFSSGIKIRMYVGFHPKVEEYTEGKQIKCGKECYYYFNNADGRGYVLYQESKKLHPKYVHMMFEGINSENKIEVDKFLKDTRRCSLKNKIVCEKRSLFLIN